MALPKSSSVQPPLCSVISAGCTAYGKREGLSGRDLVCEALDELFSNCPKLSAADVGAFYLGQAFPESFEHEANNAAGAASDYGLGGVAAVRVESVSSSGGSALRQGVLAIASGEFDVVVCAGAEKMTGPATDVALEAISMASSRPFEQWNGATLAGLNALSAREHMRKYGTTEEDLALVSVKNHHNAFYNPKAYLRKKITTADVLSSRPIATPLKLLDCSPICDGASCVALCRPELAGRLSDAAVDVVGSGEASDSDFVFRENLTSFAATRSAARQALSRAGLRATDMDLIEVHDAFSMNELIAYEDLGLCPEGGGKELARSGATQIGGRGVPVNTSGGLKAKGHPVGSSGVGQAYEVFTQLTGRVEAPERAVRGAQRALTHSMGGAGVTCQVHVFEARG